MHEADLTGTWKDNFNRIVEVVKLKEPISFTHASYTNDRTIYYNDDGMGSDGFMLIERKRATQTWDE